MSRVSRESGKLTFDLEGLLQKFHDRAATIGIVGLGYVGIPLALAATRAGFHVIGADIDAPRVAQINRGESFIKHIPAAAMQEAVGAGRLSATTEMARLAEADAILICVPTPLTRHREPDVAGGEDSARLPSGDRARRDDRNFPHLPLPCCSAGGAVPCACARSLAEHRHAAAEDARGG